MDKIAYFGLFLKLLEYQLSRLSAKTLKKKLVNLGGLSRKCAFQVFIIQKLDVVTLNP
jgi:hypothetical protein